MTIKNESNIITIRFYSHFSFNINTQSIYFEFLKHSIINMFVITTDSMIKDRSGYITVALPTK